MEKTYSFDAIPSESTEITVTSDPFRTAALTVLVLCRYKDNPEKTFEMLDVLKGPASISVFERQFLRDRLGGKEYKPFSFFAGATPQNDYTPSLPYTITVSNNDYSYPEENYANLWVKSSGADSPREIHLRKKPSTGQWFLVEQMILSDIRIPTSQDEWA